MYMVLNIYFWIIKQLLPVSKLLIYLPRPSSSIIKVIYTCISPTKISSSSRSAKKIVSCKSLLQISEISILRNSFFATQAKEKNLGLLHKFISDNYAPFTSHYALTVFYQKHVVCSSDIKTRKPSLFDIKRK